MIVVQFAPPSHFVKLRSFVLHFHNLVKSGRKWLIPAAYLELDHQVVRDAWCLTVFGISVSWLSVADKICTCVPENGEGCSDCPPGTFVTIRGNAVLPQYTA
jgi:hypothetical protein